MVSGDAACTHVHTYACTLGSVIDGCRWCWGGTRVVTRNVNNGNNRTHANIPHRSRLWYRVWFDSRPGRRGGSLDRVAAVGPRTGAHCGMSFCGQGLPFPLARTHRDWVTSWPRCNRLPLSRLTRSFRIIFTSVRVQVAASNVLNAIIHRLLATAFRHPFLWTWKSSGKKYNGFFQIPNKFK